jgi:LuxR family maltose regulon positive regulatory protein
MALATDADLVAVPGQSVPARSRSARLTGAHRSFALWTSVVERICAEGRDLRPLRHWDAVLHALWRRFPKMAGTLPPRALRAALAAAALAPTALHTRSLLVELALARLAGAGAAERAALSAALCVLYLRMGDFAGARVAADEGHVAGAALPAGRLGVHPMMVQAMACWLFGNGARAREWAMRAEAAGAAALNHALAGALTDGDGRAADDFCNRIATSIQNGRPLDQALYRYLLAWRAMQRGETREAYTLLEICAAQLRDLDDRVGLACVLADQAHAAHLLGEARRASRLNTEALAISAATGSGLAAFKALLVQAEMCADPDAALVMLARAMTVGRRGAMYNFPGWHAPMMARLAARALGAGIEPAYLSALVRSRGLGCPASRPLAWPWQLRLHTLGRFEVLYHGVPLQQDGKGQRRALDLLKAITAFGGTDVAIERLTAVLWPDADGDKAKGAFDVAMHRLRKMIGGDHLFLVGNGKVSINRDCCWLDIWAFQAQVQGVLDRLADDRADVGGIIAGAGEMLAIYRGRFLASEPDQLWILPTRERLHRQLERTIDLAGVRLQACGREREATALYLRVRQIEQFWDLPDYAPPA